MKILWSALLHRATIKNGRPTWCEVEIVHANHWDNSLRFQILKYAIFKNNMAAAAGFWKMKVHISGKVRNISMKFGVRISAVIPDHAWRILLLAVKCNLAWKCSTYCWRPFWNKCQKKTFSVIFVNIAISVYLFWASRGIIVQNMVLVAYPLRY